MPKNSYDESYQDWAKREQEVKLTALFTDSLMEIAKSREYPLQDFALPTLYAPSQKKSLPGIIESISVAITRCDADAVGKLMGPSIIPHKIKLHQVTQQRYWNWLNTSRLLLFYCRVEYLFWGVQRKYFYASLLNAINCVEEVPAAERAPGAPCRKPSAIGANIIKKYFQEVTDKSYREAQFNFDLYAEQLGLPANADIRNLFNFLTPHRKSAVFRDKKFRVQATHATRNTLKNTLNTPVISLTARHSTELIRRDDSPFLMEACYRFLTQVDPQSQRYFTHWLHQSIQKKTDSGVIGQSIENSILSLIKDCLVILGNHYDANDDLVEMEEEMLANFNDTHIIKSGIANLSLQDERFNVVDKERKTIVPMLHYAMSTYAKAFEERDVENALNNVKLLISRGASMFQSFVITKLDMDTSSSSNALEYADLQPNWQLLACALEYTLTFTQFSEQLRIALLGYATRNANTTRDWVLAIFRSKKNLEERMWLVSHLTSMLQTGDKYNDNQLLRTINNIMQNHTSYFTNSKLHRLLNTISRKTELMCIPAGEEVEMEMRPLSPSSEEQKTQESPPSSFSLMRNSLFAPSSRYVQVTDVEPELKLDDAPAPSSPEMYTYSRIRL